VPHVCIEQTGGRWPGSVLKSPIGECWSTRNRIVEPGTFFLCRSAERAEQLIVPHHESCGPGPGHRWNALTTQLTASCWLGPGQVRPFLARFEVNEHRVCSLHECNMLRLVWPRSVWRLPVPAAAARVRRPPAGPGRPRPPGSPGPGVQLEVRPAQSHQPGSLPQCTGIGGQSLAVTVSPGPPLAAAVTVTLALAAA
jgi:hypothetical protein